jgi:hypothetical protein
MILENGALSQARHLTTSGALPSRSTILGRSTTDIAGLSIESYPIRKPLFLVLRQMFFLR